MDYITQAGRENLAKYAYKGEDRSLLYKYVLSPWAQFCVDRFTPHNVAPNTITLIGLLLQAAAYILLFSQSGDFQQDVSGGYLLFAAVALFAYSTLDNMDGKQARKIGASSPLGLLFDHGCDCINTGMLGSLIMGMALKAGADTWQMYALWGTAVTAFFMNTWEEFHIREFILPIVNGPSEGLMMMVAFLGITSVYSQDMWMQPVPAWLWPAEALFSPILSLFRYMAHDANTVTKCGELMVVGSAFFLIFTCIFNTINVARHAAKTNATTATRATFRAILTVAPILFVHGAAFLWFSSGDFVLSIKNHPHVFYLTVGAIAADMTSKLMVSHVTDQAYVPDYRALAVFAAGPVVFWLANKLKWSLPTMFNLADPNMWLYISFVVACVQLELFLYFNIREIARVLDIDVFDPSRQMARAARNRPATA